MWQLNLPQQQAKVKNEYGMWSSVGPGREKMWREQTTERVYYSHSSVEILRYSWVLERNCSMIRWWPDLLKWNFIHEIKANTTSAAHSLTPGLYHSNYNGNRSVKTYLNLSSVMRKQGRVTAFTVLWRQFPKSRLDFESQLISPLHLQFHDKWEN